MKDERAQRRGVRLPPAHKFCSFCNGKGWREVPVYRAREGLSPDPVKEQAVCECRYENAWTPLAGSGWERGQFGPSVLWVKGRGVGSLSANWNPDLGRCMWTFCPFNGSPPFEVGPTTRREDAMREAGHVLGSERRDVLGPSVDDELLGTVDRLREEVDVLFNHLRLKRAPGKEAA